MTNRYGNSMEIRRAVLGDIHVDRAEAAKTGFVAPFQLGEVVIISIIGLFPGLVMFLPNMMQLTSWSGLFFICGSVSKI